jgi:uncharacterized RDD family membrane protein YckC
MDQPGRPEETPPQSGNQTPPPPPEQGWQSTPQQPAPPPPASAPPGGGMPSWTANLTDQRPVPGPAGLFYADVPNRSIAMVIDVVAMIIVYVIVGLITVAILGTNLGFVTVASTPALLAQWLIGQLIWVGYFIYTWVAMRGTIGMKLLGLQIGHEIDGRTITYEQAAWRFAVLFGPNVVLGLLSSLAPALGLLGFLGLVWLIYVLITMAQSPTKQGIHDKYAHTMVVKAGRSLA